MKQISLLVVCFICLYNSYGQIEEGFKTECSFKVSEIETALGDFSWFEKNSMVSDSFFYVEISSYMGREIIIIISPDMAEGNLDGISWNMELTNKSFKMVEIEKNRRTYIIEKSLIEEISLEDVYVSLMKVFNI